MTGFALVLRYWWAGVILALVLVCAGQQARVSRAKAQTAGVRSELDGLRATHAESARLAERSRRETEQRWAAAVQGVSNAGQQKIDVARADAVRAGAAEQRMQQRVSAFLAAVRRTAADSGIATAGKATPDPAVLLADLFGRARERARLLGQFADDAHARGQTCEAYADRLQPAAK